MFTTEQEMSRVEYLSPEAGGPQDAAVNFAGKPAEYAEYTLQTPRPELAHQVGRLAGMAVNTLEGISGYVIEDTERLVADTKTGARKLGAFATGLWRKGSERVASFTESTGERFSDARGHLGALATKTVATISQRAEQVGEMLDRAEDVTINFARNAGSLAVRSLVAVSQSVDVASEALGLSEPTGRHAFIARHRVPTLGPEAGLEVVDDAVAAWRRNETTQPLSFVRNDHFATA